MYLGITRAKNEDLKEHSFHNKMRWTVSIIVAVITFWAILY